MARGKKTGGRDFKPGNTFQKPAPIELREARKLTKTQLDLILNKFLNWPFKDLKNFAENPNNPVLDMFVARILVKGIAEGDTQRLNFIFDRLVGKVKEVKEITTPKPTIMKLLDGKTEIVLGSTDQVVDAVATEIIKDET